MNKGYEQQILSYLAEHEMLSTAEAMRFLPLSEVSIRRIFNKLAESNLVRRVRGGEQPDPVLSARTMVRRRKAASGKACGGIHHA